MSEMGKAAKRMGYTNPNDIRRSPAMPDKATPAKVKSHPTKQYGIAFRYNPSLSWLKFRRPHHKWFKTKTARDQSLACMRREEHGGRPFYADLEVIDP